MSSFFGTGTEPIKWSAEDDDSNFFQTSDNYLGGVEVDMRGANPDELIDLDGSELAGSGDSSSSSNGGTIRENIPANNSDSFVTYTNTGSGNDRAFGSDENDIIRMGAGNDTAEGGDGDDLFRL